MIRDRICRTFAWRSGKAPAGLDRVRDNLATFKATGKLPALAGGAATGAAVFTPTAGYPAQPDQPPSQSVNQSPGFDDWWRQLQAQRFAQQARPLAALVRIDDPCKAQREACGKGRLPSAALQRRCTEADRFPSYRLGRNI